jgi:hypothetical protein
MAPHLKLLFFFALLLACILAALLQASLNQRIRYGFRAFFLFVGLGFVIAWLMFPFSR